MEEKKEKKKIITKSVIENCCINEWLHISRRRII